MKAIIQVVSSAKLEVEGEVISEIEKGLVVFFGVGAGDTLDKADYIVKKISSLRIFEDENGKTNLSLKDVGGEVLFVSQFTLYANTEHGNRPDFLAAEKPDRANEVYEYALSKFKDYDIVAKKGVFGAHMVIMQVNEGPFSVIMER